MSRKISLYVNEPDGFHHWIKKLELSYNEVYEAEKSEIHEAIFRVAQNHQHEVVEEVAGHEVEEKTDGHLFEYPSDEGGGS